MWTTRARIIGYDGKGRPIREIRGGSVNPPEQPPADTGGAQPVDDLGDLIGDPDPGDGGAGEPQGDGEAPPAWWNAASAQMQQTILQQTTSEIDRRINQLTRRTQQTGQQQQNGQQTETPQQTPSAGVSAADLRDARGAYREAWQDQNLRLSQEEREIVNSAVPGLLSSALQRDPDPDAAGLAVAASVAGLVRKLRSSYQTRIVQRLEQSGALDRSKIKQGTPNSTAGQQRGAAPDWQQGQAKAHELLARRGMNVPQQTTN